MKLTLLASIVDNEIYIGYSARYNARANVQYLMKESGALKNFQLRTPRKSEIVLAKDQSPNEDGEFDF